MKKYILILLALALTFSGCEAFLIPPDSGSSQTAIFDEAWHFADRHYTFFDYKGIDWDDARARYEPLVNDSISDDSLFNVLAAMLYELRDGHVNLASDFNVSRNARWYLDSPPNFDADLLERSYFREEEEYAGPFVLYDFGDVGYVRYSSFLNTITWSNLNYLMQRFGDREGWIIDIRNNGGGSLLNAYTFAELFTADTVAFGQMQVKNGPNHADLSAPMEELIQPDPEDTTFTKPLVLLTNRSSYSASNTFTLMMQSLPQVTMIGDTTGGGGGAPADTELANGWILRVSGTVLRDPSGFNVENGIPPDEGVTLTQADEAAGVDPIIERALQILRE